MRSTMLSTAPSRCSITMQTVRQQAPRDDVTLGAGAFTATAPLDSPIVPAQHFFLVIQDVGSQTGSQSNGDAHSIHRSVR